MIDHKKLSMQMVLDVEFAKKQKGNLDKISEKIRRGDMYVDGYVQFQISQTSNAIECLLRGVEAMQKAQSEAVAP